MESQSAPEQIPNLPNQATLRLLVVEDNLTNQKVILRQLQSLGYEADLVGHGQAALDRIAQTFYAIVLMDCRLPGIDGYSATRLIRQREQERILAGQAPLRSIIIALTASDEPQDQAAAMAAGMDDFLMKPLRRETLAATLNHWQNVFVSQIARQPAAPPLDAPTSTLIALLQNLQFDLERLHQLSDHNLAFEQELLQLYLDDTRLQMQQLQQASQQQDLSTIEKIAHHIKGASGSIGASHLELLAEGLEQQARYHQPEASLKLLQELMAKFEQVQSQLRTVL